MQWLYGMNKIVLILIALISCAASVSAEPRADIGLRFIRDDDTSSRIVLEAGDQVIRNTNTIATLSQIRVEFPGIFEMKKPKEFPFEVVKSDRYLTIALRDVSDIRAYKLADPSRIVIHLRTAVRAAPPAAPQAAQRIPQEVAPQPAAITRPQAAVPPKAPVRRISVVVIDPGHGGYDFGIFDGQTKEKDLNLSLSRDVADMLLRKGYKPYILRRTDQFLSIIDRIQTLISRRPDLVISIHASMRDSFTLTLASADDTQTDAAVSLYGVSSRQARHHEQSSAFSSILADTIREDYKAEVFIEELPLPLLRSADAPAILVEYPSFLSADYDPKAKQKFAETITKAISSYAQ